MTQRNPKSFINSITKLKQVMWTPKELESLIWKIPSLRDRAYCSFIYLTGCRKSEPLPHYKKTKEFKKWISSTGKKREWTGKIIKTKVQGFTVGQIVRQDRIDKSTKKLIPFIDFQNIYVAKKRGIDYLNHVRTVPVNAILYRNFINFIFQYIRNERLGKEAIIFTFGGKTAERIVDKGLGTPVHFLRHLRGTHLRTIHNYDEIDLQRFFGWEDGRPAKTYIHLNPTDLALKQI